MAVTRIAYQLGYRDAANFSRAFRRRQGLTPLAYRNRSRDSDAQAEGD
jgi:AraC-like DNA-binding protein